MASAATRFAPFASAHPRAATTLVRASSAATPPLATVATALQLKDPTLLRDQLYVGGSWLGEASGGLGFRV